MPRAALVHVLGEQVAAIAQRSPVAVCIDHIAQLGTGDLQHPRMVELVRLHDADVRVLYGPHHAAQHGRGDLQRGRVVVRRQLPGPFDRQAGTEPAGAPLVPQPSTAG